MTWNRKKKSKTNKPKKEKYVKKTTEEIANELTKLQSAINDQILEMEKLLEETNHLLHIGLNCNNQHSINEEVTMDQKLLKDLQIKTNVVKRLVKEYHSYEKEAEKQKEKIEKMKSTPDVDEYAVKKANEVLQETRNMLPMTASRVKKACAELREFIDQNTVHLESTEQLTHAYEELKSGDSIS